MSLCIYIESWESCILRSCVPVFLILCCDTYAVSLRVEGRSVGALAMGSWPRDTGPCQGKI